MSYDPSAVQVALLQQAVVLQQQQTDLTIQLLAQLKVLNWLASEGFPVGEDVEHLTDDALGSVS